MTMINSVPGCSGKRPYETLKAAQWAALSIHKRAGGQKPDAYHCKACGSYHFGRNPKKQEKPSMLAMTEQKRVNAPPAVENRELSWLSQRVAQGRKQPFSEIVTITPAIARHILEVNPDNRQVKESLVSQIAMDICAGKWDLNGEAIIISASGELNDGQHRLNAVVQSGMPIKTVVTFGMDRDSRYTVDMGAARTTGDFLGMEGGKYANVIAAGARLHNIYRRGYYSVSNAKGGNPPPTKAMIRQEYWGNQKVFDRAAEQLVSEKLAKRAGQSVMVAAHVILHRANDAQAEYFFSKLCTGADLRVNDPILALRSRLMEGVAKKPENKLEMILRHWNAWRRKESMKRYQPQGSFPKVER